MILNALTLYINLYKPLFINYDVTNVKVDSNSCHACLSLMPEVTCLIEGPIPYTSMPEVVKMVAYLAFLIHLQDKSPSSYGHSWGCQVIDFGSLT